MSRRRIFNEVITDLIGIGSIYQYLVNHWHKHHIIVDVWENNIRQPKRIMTDYDTCERFYRYLLDNWTVYKIKVTIWEQDIGAI